jgi:calcineurin-like phosphoesterase family protein
MWNLTLPGINEMTIFFTSDTHFGHANIIHYCNRPFDNADEMNEAMIKVWNETVSPNDEVFHLGDVAFMPFGKLNQLLRRLNGSIHLCLGNHDGMVERNAQALLNDGKIRSIQNYRELRIESELFVLFHYGQRVWNGSHKGSVHLYGHSHGILPPFGKSVDVGVDCKEITPEYRPISLDEIIVYMMDRLPVQP